MWRAIRSGAVGKPLIAYAEFDDNLIYLMHPEGWQSRSGALAVPARVRGRLHVGACRLPPGVAVYDVRPGEVGDGVSERHCQIRPTSRSTPADTPDFSVATVDFVSGPVARITCSIAGRRTTACGSSAMRARSRPDTYRHYQSPVRLSGSRRCR